MNDLIKADTTFLKQTVKNMLAMQETWVWSLDREDLLERSGPTGPSGPTPVFLPGESHRQGAWWAIVHGVAESWTQLSI